MRHTSICQGTSTVKTRVSGVHTISMRSMNRHFMMRRLVFGLETLNSQWYCDNIVYPFIAQLKEDEIDKAYFQQDGTTAHTAHTSVALLDNVFVARIISKTIWPPRYTDLSPPDFFLSPLLGTMKTTVYSNSPHTIDD